MIVRQATRSDVGLIAPLFDQYRQFYNQPPNTSGALAFVEERFAQNDSIIFLASSPQSASMGFAQIYPSLSSISMQKFWILNDLFVAPSFRNQDVAKALISSCVAAAKHAQAKGLTLKTSTENRSAQRLYESLGWKREHNFVSYDLIF